MLSPKTVGTDDATLPLHFGFFLIFECGKLPASSCQTEKFCMIHYGIPWAYIFWATLTSSAKLFLRLWLAFHFVAAASRESVHTCCCEVQRRHMGAGIWPPSLPPSCTIPKLRMETLSLPTGSCRVYIHVPDAVARHLPPIIFSISCISRIFWSDAITISKELTYTVSRENNTEILESALMLHSGIQDSLFDIHG